ncbi:hypothetical protein GPECTOR_49g498 [Gonium pectorale]|uniref:Guanylate cyclase domain-containing protein n=1 Tax=Gonium pectorale TaxID=33097 RepID=A0A150G7V0_GONPE|nr:hypothetical protein GPECTOR_49g498 [Gonium pectorale]|eukprot:KXZ45914.1 hypothetical protein GPECTOR_49g498 [Gonium pectorale]
MCQPGPRCAMANTACELQAPLGPHAPVRALLLPPHASGITAPSARFVSEPQSQQSISLLQPPPSLLSARLREPPGCASICIKSLPCCVTVLQLPGRVLFQNPRSLAFFGDVTGRPLGSTLLNLLLGGGEAGAGEHGAVKARQGGLASGTPEVLRQQLMAALERGEEFEAVVRIHPSAFTASLLEVWDEAVTEEEVGEVEDAQEHRAGLGLFFESNDPGSATGTCTVTGTQPGLSRDHGASLRPDALDQELLAELAASGGGGGGSSRCASRGTTRSGALPTLRQRMQRSASLNQAAHPGYSPRGGALASHLCSTWFGPGAGRPAGQVVRPPAGVQASAQSSRTATGNGTSTGEADLAAGRAGRSGAQLRLGNSGPDERCVNRPPRSGVSLSGLRAMHASSPLGGVSASLHGSGSVHGGAGGGSRRGSQRPDPSVRVQQLLSSFTLAHAPPLLLDMTPGAGLGQQAKDPRAGGEPRAPPSAETLQATRGSRGSAAEASPTGRGIELHRARSRSGRLGMAAHNASPHASNSRFAPSPSPSPATAAALLDSAGRRDGGAGHGAAGGADVADVVAYEPAEAYTNLLRTEQSAMGAVASHGLASVALRRPTYHRVHIVPYAGAVTEGGSSSAASATRSRGPLTLTVTQVDMSEQVEVQSQLSRLLEQEHKLLESIFPRHVIEYMTLSNAAAAAGPALGADGGSLLRLAGAAGSACKLASLATWHPCVTILFCDIVGFTSACHASTPLTVMTFLNELYSHFDGLVDIYKVYKVETIGDCYVVAGGLVAYDEDGYKSVISGTEDPLHALRVLEFAKAMLRAAREVRLPHTGEPVKLRVGLHSGPVTSGVVGDRMPRFCLFGDTVNVASRMESTCRPGRIHASAATQSRLPREPWRDCGMTAVKGKGEMRTFEWAGEADEPLDGEQLNRVLGLYL